MRAEQGNRATLLRGGMRFALADQAAVFKAYSPVFFRIALFHRIKEPQPGLNCLKAKWASSVEVSGNLSSGNIK